MSNTYQLTREIHEQIDYLAEQKGIFIKIESNYEWIIQSDGVFNSLYNDNHSSSYLIAIQEKEIKQILVALKDILGEKPTNTAISYWCDWCCGFPQSEFETNPDQVLTELLEILKSI
jgi:hypothetical protein